MANIYHTFKTLGFGRATRDVAFPLTQANFTALDLIFKLLEERIAKNVNKLLEAGS